MISWCTRVIVVVACCEAIPYSDPIVCAAGCRGVECVAVGRDYSEGKLTHDTVAPGTGGLYTVINIGGTGFYEFHEARG